MDKAKLIVAGKILGLILAAALAIWGGVKVITNFQNSIVSPPAPVATPVVAPATTSPAAIVPVKPEPAVQKK